VREGYLLGRGEVGLEPPGEGLGEAILILGALVILMASSSSSSPDINLLFRGLRLSFAGVELVLELGNEALVGFIIHGIRSPL
jgi:hypothetical protein